jgi:hypothetical protein
MVAPWPPLLVVAEPFENSERGVATEGHPYKPRPYFGSRAIRLGFIM